MNIKYKHVIKYTKFRQTLFKLGNYAKCQSYLILLKLSDLVTQVKKSYYIHK
jgi:hypothetical protein